MVNYKKITPRGIFIGISGFLIGVVSFLFYSGALAWKEVVNSTLSFNEEISNSDSSVAGESCFIGEETDKDDVFFISCGGIY